MQKLSNDKYVAHSLVHPGRAIYSKTGCKYRIVRNRSVFGFAYWAVCDVHKHALDSIPIPPSGSDRALTEVASGLYRRDCRDLVSPKEEVKLPELGVPPVSEGESHELEMQQYYQLFM